MDAKDRLRRYLEQRREMGESELVLDSLSIDDVMSMLGAKAGAPTPRAQPTAAAPKAHATSSTDRNADAVPPAASTSSSPADSIPSDYESEPLAALVAPVLPPPKPDVRFDSGATTDWREALRNAGAPRPAESSAPALPAAPPPSPPPVTADAPVRSAASAPLESPSLSALPAWLTALQLPAGLEAGRLRMLDAAPEIASLPSLADVAEHVIGCTRCTLFQSAMHAVPGEGRETAELMCIGEAPGVSEDEAGRPFVGEAGDLLMKILGAIQLSREDVFMSNLLKHRPPASRDPLPDEVRACQPFLLRELEIVRPRVILALGRVAAQSLLQTTSSISDLRGRVHLFHGIPLIVTYHPAALLRNESWKRPTWEDVKLARRILDASRADRSDTTGQ